MFISECRPETERMAAASRWGRSQLDLSVKDMDPLCLLPNGTEISEISTVSGLLDGRLVGWKVCVGALSLTAARHKEAATKMIRICSHYSL